MSLNKEIKQVVRVRRKFWSARKKTMFVVELL